MKLLLFTLALLIPIIVAGPLGEELSSYTVVKVGCYDFAAIVECPDGPLRKNGTVRLMESDMFYNDVLVTDEVLRLGNNDALLPAALIDPLGIKLRYRYGFFAFHTCIDEWGANNAEVYWEFTNICKPNDYYRVPRVRLQDHILLSRES